MFQGLSTALSALYADRQALETTGNNIANVNTEGYARQRVDQVDIAFNNVSFWANNTAVGQGARVVGISRITDSFLQTRALTAHGTQGQVNATNDGFQQIQDAFAEPSDTGMQAQLSKFWSTWHDVAISPDLPARTQLVEQGNTLVSSIQQISQALKDQKVTTLDKIKGDVSQINAIAQSVADLNKAIQAQVNTGNQPNALFDQRDQLLSQLSDVAQITTSAGESGSVTVSVGGRQLVTGDRVIKMQVDDTGAPVVVRWDTDGDTSTVTDGNPVNLLGGDLGGQVDMLNTTIPKYESLLNNVASALITTVNTQHALGEDAYGNAGGQFFTGTDATTISVNSTISNDPNLIAAAGAGAGELDVTNAQAIANLASTAGGPDAMLRQLVGVLGVEAQRATNQATIQQNITNSVDSSLQAVQGVNLDEEMTNMVRYQRAYQSAAKYLSVINDTLDTLMGVVR